MWILLSHTRLGCWTATSTVNRCHLILNCRVCRQSNPKRSEALRRGYARKRSQGPVNETGKCPKPTGTSCIHFFCKSSCRWTMIIAEYMSWVPTEQIINQSAHSAGSPLQSLWTSARQLEEKPSRGTNRNHTHSNLTFSVNLCQFNITSEMLGHGTDGIQAEQLECAIRRERLSCIICDDCFFPCQLMMHRLQPRSI